MFQRVAPKGRFCAILHESLRMRSVPFLSPMQQTALRRPQGCAVTRPRRKTINVIFHGLLHAIRMCSVGGKLSFLPALRDLAN